MPKCSRHRSYGKTFSTPRRPYEKERIDQELKILGEYGLRCKREVWRVQLLLAKTRKAARKLLTLDDKDPKRIFEGDALLRRMVRYGLLSEGEKSLDDILRLSTRKFLDRRLQTVAKERKFAQTIHQARVMIKQRHMAVNGQLVDVPSFMMRTDSEGGIDFSLRSAIGHEDRHGRKTKKKAGKASE